MPTSADFAFPEPWWDLRTGTEQESQQRAALAHRLGIETADGHPLFGTSVSAIGRCTACDHVLYAIGDSRYAIVHLTWTASPPVRPPWPSTTVYSSWEETELAVMAHEPDWDNQPKN